jgi:hypothetical protein
MLLKGMSNLLQNICRLLKEPYPNKGNRRSNCWVPVPRGDKLCNPVPGLVLGKASQKSLVQRTTSNMR